MYKNSAIMLRFPVLCYKKTMLRWVLFYTNFECLYVILASGTFWNSQRNSVISNLCKYFSNIVISFLINELLL